MAAPIVYRWDDGNAPVARGERRSLCDILYACLVTGYGTKPGAGWTREYVNATFDKAAFRNNPVTGTGFYLQVDGAGAPYAYASLIRGFEVMTSVDNGLFPFKPAATVQDAGGTSSQASLTARPWVVVADDRAFYYVCWTSTTGTPADAVTTVSVVIFGDIVSRYPEDPYGCVVMASHSQASYGPNGFNLGSPNVTPAGYINMPRPISGVATPSTPSLVRGGGPGAVTYPGGSDGNPYSPGDQILITRPHLTDATIYSFRGWLPGFHYPCHPFPFSNLAQVIVDGRSFLAVRHICYGQALSGMLIQLDDWRA